MRSLKREGIKKLNINTTSTLYTTKIAAKTRETISFALRLIVAKVEDLPASLNKLVSRLYWVPIISSKIIKEEAKLKTVGSKR